MAKKDRMVQCANLIRPRLTMNDLYTYTVPVFIKSLGGLEDILQKAEAHAKEKSLDEGALLADRLWPDMFPLARQVEIACDNAKLATARLSGVEAPSFPDGAVTFAALHERVAKTLAYLETVPEASFKAAAEKEVTLPYFPGKYMTGFDYAREYAIPNFFFHLVTTYALVRKNGVPIGKADYIHGMPLHDLA